MLNPISNVTSAGGRRQLSRGNTRALHASVSAALLVALLSSFTARAQTLEILQRLMAEPVSLFDWGLAQLDRDIERAGLRLFGPTTGGTPPETGTIYDWRRGRVTLFLSLQVPEQGRTADACTALFDRLVPELAAGAPAGDAAGWYLRNAFQPKGHFWTSRFKDVGGKLLDVIELEVSLIAPPYGAAAGDKQRVRCSGRLNATPEALLIEVAGAAGSEDGKSPAKPAIR